MVGSWADAQGNPTRPETTLTLLFEDLGGKTKLTLHNAIFESVTARDMHQERMEQLRSIALADTWRRPDRG